MSLGNRSLRNSEDVIKWVNRQQGKNKFGISFLILFSSYQQLWRFLLHLTLVPGFTMWKLLCFLTEASSLQLFPARGASKLVWVWKVGHRRQQVLGSAEALHFSSWWESRPRWVHCLSLSLYFKIKSLWFS